MLALGLGGCGGTVGLFGILRFSYERECVVVVVVVVVDLFPVLGL